MTSTATRVLLGSLFAGTVMALWWPGTLTLILGVLALIGIVGSIFLAGLDTVRWFNRRARPGPRAAGQNLSVW